MTGGLAGATIGTAIAPGIGTAIGAGLGALGGAAIGAFGNKDERQLRKQLAADQARLAGGAGGMSQGALQQAQAGMAGTVQAQQQQALAQLARGSAMGGGESGIQTAKMGAVLGAGQQAMQQGMGQLRQQDLAYAQQQRAMNAQIQQMLMNKAQARSEQINQQIAKLGEGGVTQSQAAEASAQGSGQRSQGSYLVQALADKYGNG